MTATADKSLHQPAEFSLVLGGPLFQLWRRVRLSDDALALLRRRIITISLACWLPLLVLAIVDGSLLRGTAVVPFLLDVEVHAKFLLVVPLLIYGELVVHRRMRSIVVQFLDRRLIPDAAMPRFDAAVASMLRLRNSVLAEVLLIALVYGVGVLVVWRHYMVLDAATWYATPTAEGLQLSLSGIWYGYVSLPIAQFLLLRWYFRIFIWARFLWQVSRIDLALMPAHPDRTGGLGFLAGTAQAFIPLAIAHGALLASQLANRIFHLGATLPEFKLDVALVVVFMLILFLGPLLLTAPRIWQAELRGKREFGALAHRYVREFDAKWMRGGAAPDEPLVGSADIQSLADLAGGIEPVYNMRLAPVSRDAVLQITAATLAPILPLALTMMPLEELVKRLFGMLF